MLALLGDRYSCSWTTKYNENVSWINGATYSYVQISCVGTTSIYFRHAIRYWWVWGRAAVASTLESRLVYSCFWVDIQWLVLTLVSRWGKITRNRRSSSIWMINPNFSIVVYSISLTSFAHGNTLFSAHAFTPIHTPVQNITTCTAKRK